jgi:2-iminobutanoate/2-iminopropanoate deaminase
MREIIRVPGISDVTDAVGAPLSAVTKGAGLVFVSGMPPIDAKERKIPPGLNVAEQTRICMENVKASLEAAGSSLDKVLKVTIYATNSATYGTINKVYAGFFKDGKYPARTFVAVASWPMEFDVEIECVALS